MNVDAIKQKILEDARQAAARTLEEAGERARQIRLNSEEKMLELRMQQLKQAEQDGSDAHERMIRMAELEERKKDLATKREVIDQAFENALERMRGMDITMAQIFLKRLLLEAADGTEQILVDERDAALYTDSFLHEVNAALVKKGLSGELRLSSERRPLGGGFVLLRQGVEINCTYSAVIKQMKPDLEADVAAILFQ